MIELIATVLIVISTLPLLVKVYRTKSVEDLSLVQMATLTIGLLFWLFYGIQINSFAIILVNAISIFLEVILISMKIIYSKGNINE